jgi:hypothetical protein
MTLCISISMKKFLEKGIVVHINIYSKIDFLYIINMRIMYHTLVFTIKVVIAAYL